MIRDAMAAVDGEACRRPTGTYFVWAGEFENQQRAMARLKLIVPLALLVVLGLLLLGARLGAQRACDPRSPRRSR